MRVLMTALLALVVSGSLPCALAADSGASLAGVWVLDERASDDPSRVLRDGEHGGGFGSRVAGGVSIFGIPVGSLPRPEGSDDEIDPEEDLRGAEHVFESLYRLTIRSDGDATQIAYGNAPVIAYEPGTAVERDGAVARAEWRGEALVVEHELDDGTRVSEKYWVEPRSGELHWTVRLKRRKASAVDIERIFYPAPAAGP
jgi:hypothetical protein